MTRKTFWKVRLANFNEMVKLFPFTLTFVLIRGWMMRTGVGGGGGEVKEGGEGGGGGGR